MPPPNNRLALPARNAMLDPNALGQTVPAPYIPGTTPTPASRFVPGRELENLSIGMGRGITGQLEGTKQMLTDPVGTVRSILEVARQIGADPMAVLRMLQSARQQAMSGALGAGEMIGGMLPITPTPRPSVMRELDVYHGTPHRFPATEANPLGEFDASKIGTGEGAQAYGHGVYFSEAPDVAKGYRERLSGTNPNVFRLGEDEFSIVGGSPEFKKFVSAAKQKGFSTESAVLAYQTLRQFDGNLNAASGELGWRDIAGPFDEEAANLLRAVQFKPEGGAFYKADLPDEMIDRMLDYDKPINEQSQVVLDALERAGINTQSTALAGPMAQGQEGHLAKYGIPGIKYADAGSRGQGGSGTRNFVVFPGEEKKVRILERK